MIFSRGTIVLMACVLGAVAAGAVGEDALRELRSERKRLAERPRRLIANNDGCDAFYFPRAIEPTVENFLGRRLALLVGKQAGTVSYCTISSGFGFFTHNTRIGEVLTRQGADYGIRPNMRNITADLIEQGTDTLRAVTEYAHANGLECFWSMRMNDTHDVAHKPNKPYLLYPQLKEEHPEWLVGEVAKRTKNGRWSSVDYGRPEIRELAFRYIEEVCRNYDVDGIDLDFFRHLCYFRSVANGGKASRAELDGMTALMRRVREITEKVGMERGRPILVLMRVPDCVEFCRASGLDIETWLEEGLLDILVTTGYFRLNPWEYSVAMGHKYGIKVYSSLDESRVKGETRFKRRSVAAYRGRAANAWAAGVDGLYLFNLYDVQRDSPLWVQLGDPVKLAFTDKLYFVTNRDDNLDYWLSGGKSYRNTPLLTPAAPAILEPGKKFNTRITIADDAAAAVEAGLKSAVTLHLNLPGIKDAATVQVVLNDKELSAGVLKDGWVDLAVEPASLRKGANDLAVTCGAAGGQKLCDAVLQVAYSKKD